MPSLRGSGSRQTISDLAQVTLLIQCLRSQLCFSVKILGCSLLCPRVLEDGDLWQWHASRQITIPLYPAINNENPPMRRYACLEDSS